MAKFVRQPKDADFESAENTLNQLKIQDKNENENENENRDLYKPIVDKLADESVTTFEKKGERLVEINTSGKSWPGIINQLVNKFVLN